MPTEYQYWQHKKSGQVFAVKLMDSRPARICGSLKEGQYKSPDGRLLGMKLEVFDYDDRLEDDAFNYVICDD